LVKCSYCDENISFLPFKCRYCRNYFCKNHRLPENHECTFEFKHIPKFSEVPITSREFSLKKEISPERLYKEGEYLSEKEIRKIFKKREKEHKKRMKTTHISFLRSSQMNGTNFIVIALVIMSIIAVFLPQYLNLSGYGVLNYYYHTFFTSLFIISAEGFFGIFFLFIMIFFLYNMAKTIEQMYGTKLLLGLYIFSGLLAGLIFLLFRFLLVPLYPLNEIDSIYYSIGLGWSAILGIISFLIFPNLNRKFTLLVFFIPIRMSGKILLIFLVLIRLIPGLILGFSVGPIYIVIYCSELGGILASYLIYYSKFRYRQFD